MPQSQDHFFFGGLNTDDEQRFLPEGDYRAAYNVRGGNANQSDEGTKTSMTGNLLKSFDLPAGDNTVIGSTPWLEYNSIIYYVHNSNGDHGIYAYDYVNEGFTTIVVDPRLKFKTDYKILRSVVVNNVLYWTFGWFNSYLVDNNGYFEFNPPRMINLLTAINGGYTSITDNVLDVIKWPPSDATTALAYDTDTTLASNKIYGKTYQFITLWVYENGEESVWSPVSELPVPQNQEFISGRNYIDPLAENVLNISVPTGSEVVKKIKIAVREGNSGEFGIYKELNKELLGIPNDSTYDVVFNGLSALVPIGLVDSLRNYDRVPQVASAQEWLPSNQLVYGDIVEGYNPTEVDIVASAVNNEIKDTTNGFSTFILDITSSTITVSFNVNYNSIPFMEGDVISFTIKNSASVDGGVYVTLNYTITAQDMVAVNGFTPANALQYIAQNSLGTSILAQIINLGYSATGASVGTDYVITNTGAFWFDTATVSNTPLIPTRPFRSLKKGATHEFAIQYYDRGMRNGGVQVNAPIKLYVPLQPQADLTNFVDPNSPYYVSPRFLINHTPPEWALYYKFLTRKTTEVFDFQQRTGLLIDVDPTLPNLYRISLDSFYETYYGANVNQQIQVGDIVRIITQKSTPTTNGLASYSQEYKELEVMAYNPTGGIDSSEAIYVSFFDYQAVINGTTGFLLEIYTPKKEYITEPWYEINGTFNIGNPYTEDRYHAGQQVQGRVASPPSLGGVTFTVEGDYTWATGYVFTLSHLSDPVLVTTAVSASFDPVTQLTTITGSTPSSGFSYNIFTFNTSQTNTKGATINSTFGDVYVRPRLTNRHSGGNSELWRVYIEDYSISDYYLSWATSIGKIGIEDTNFKRKRLQSIIHGGSFIDNSNQNNICSFDFNVLNKLDFNEQYGKVRALQVNGYTLKVIQDRKETSVYIQRTMAVGANGGQEVSYTDRTFGGTNPYDSLYGTIHPASVQMVEGQVFYYDFNSSMFVRSINNGQQDISSGKYKFTEFSTRVTNYIAQAPDNWTVISKIDEMNNEYQIWFISETNVYSAVFDYEEDRWTTYLTYAPTFAGNVGKSSFEWDSSGQLYVSNAGQELVFFGVPQPFSLTYAFNTEPRINKRPLAVIMRSNLLPDAVIIETPQGANYPAMRTTLLGEVFKAIENGFHAEVLRNELDPYYETEELARYNSQMQLRNYSALVTFNKISEDKVVLWGARTNFVFSEPTQ